MKVNLNHEMNDYETQLDEISKSKNSHVVKWLFLTLITKPLHFLCEYTIPVIEKHKWSRTKAAFVPIGSTLFFLLAIKDFDMYNKEDQIALGVSVALGILIRCTTYEGSAPRTSVFALF